MIPAYNRQKNNKTGDKTGIRDALYPVLERHGLLSEPERARRIIRHIERKGPRNPWGYLEGILQRNSDFDPEEETTDTTDRSQGAISAGEILRREGWNREAGQ